MMAALGAMRWTLAQPQTGGIKAGGPGGVNGGPLRNAATAAFASG
jgi:hypothetical protein